jgi:F420-dependent oxidoreductase-like protein
MIAPVRLGLYLGYASPGTNPTELVDLAVETEGLGYDSAWAAEAWGTDVVTVLSWLGARTTRLKLGAGIMQIPGRSAGMTAMTAATLDLMSGGRFLLGLGLSGPQVAEGWHGQPWGPPLPRTREYVEIVRRMLRREVVDFHGEVYELPLTGDGTTGLGIPLKMMLRPLRPDIPIYLAAIGPRNVALAAEIGDGWLPIFVAPERLREVFGDALASARDGFDVAAGVNVVLTKDLEGGRDYVKHHLALYVGGMGARGKNFYNDLVCRYGYEAEAAEIQDLYLSGKKLEAAAAVPDALVDEVALVGSRERIADRLAAWQECGVTTLIVQSRDPETLRTMAELCL